MCKVGTGLPQWGKWRRVNPSVPQMELIATQEVRYVHSLNFAVLAM